VQFHLGRLIDHVHLRVSDLEASKRFYRAVLESLDLSAVLVEGADYFYADELFVDKASGAVSQVHLAFQALIALRSTSFMGRPWLRADATMGAPASAVTTLATTQHSCWIPTGTTSRRYITVRRPDQRHPSW
jgi:catechol 2,3-dioxygenase-like lactoylglutathione lyase family enzyme